MTTPARRQTEASIRRALAAWQGLGLPVGGMEIAPDGTIRILASAPAAPQADPLGAWLAAQNGNRDEGAA